MDAKTDQVEQRNDDNSSFEIATAAATFDSGNIHHTDLQICKSEILRYSNPDKNVFNMQIRIILTSDFLCTATQVEAL